MTIFIIATQIVYPAVFLLVAIWLWKLYRYQAISFIVASLLVSLFYAWVAVLNPSIEFARIMSRAVLGFIGGVSLVWLWKMRGGK
jgi:hypothetical protein